MIGRAWAILKRPYWRTFIPLLVLLGGGGLSYWVWEPGQVVTDGRHDLRTNGIWLSHGWLGDDRWFERNNRDTARFRSETAVLELAGRLRQNGVRDVYPHLCPCAADGRLPGVDREQAERFLTGFEGFRVMPWIGSVRGNHCSPESARWRAAFVQSACELLERHPRLAGVHINVEPMPSGDSAFLALLDEMRAGLPSGRLLSVAAYPPPTRWHPHPDVHWDEIYFRQVASRVDQLAVMMYDSGIKLPKSYERLMRDWTVEVLTWAGGTEVLLGVPAYEDAGVGYHSPRVENLRTSLRGIHAGLATFKPLPACYRGISIYSEWEMDETEWRQLSAEFGRAP